MQPHGEQHNGSSKRINLAHWPWWYLLANGRQWRTPWVDPMFGAWQPPTHSVIQQQVQPIPTILRQLHATLIQQPMIQTSLCQILCYDTLDTTTSKLWLSLQPIPYVLQLIQPSYMIQQAIKSPFSYWHNKLVRPYTTIDTARLRYVTTLPSIQQANYYYVTTSLLIPQAITFLYSYYT